MRISIWVASILTSMSLATFQAHATDTKDMQVIGRALSFVEGGANGDVTVAIVYSNDAPSSKADAETVAGLLEGGLDAGKVKMFPKLVEIGDIASASDAAAVFVPQGMSPHFPSIAGANKLTVTTDKTCVDSGSCVVYVQSAPKVEILVSQAAASASSVSFAAAFRMMIKEV